MTSLHTAANGSYWHATAAPLVPSDPLPAEADVVVIGGGMLGCWTAYWLARAGVGVTLVEKTTIGSGATGRNGGFLGSGTAVGYLDAIARYGKDEAHALWEMTQTGQRLATEVVAGEEIDCDLRSPGILSLALTEESLDEMRRDIDAMQADGFDGGTVDRHGAQGLIGTPLGLEITGGGYFSRLGGLLHSMRYLTGIATAARRHGARLCLGGVNALVNDGDGTRVETTAGTIHAGRVVVAVNAWSDELIPAMTGMIVPTRGQILAYEPIPPVFTTGLAASITPSGEYWQQTLDGSIVIGGCRADAPNGDLGVRDLEPTPDVTGSIEAVLPRLFPDLAGLRVARRWAGPMAFTADYLPIADAAPDLPGVWFGGGFCGHGMPYGPRLGQLLAEAASTGTTPAALAPLRLGRPTLASLTVPA